MASEGRIDLLARRIDFTRKADAAARLISNSDIIPFAPSYTSVFI